MFINHWSYLLFNQVFGCLWFTQPRISSKVKKFMQQFYSLQKFRSKQSLWIVTLCCTEDSTKNLRCGKITQLWNKRRPYLWSNRHFRAAKLLYSWISIVPWGREKDHNKLQGWLYVLSQRTQVGVRRFIPQTSNVGITNLDPHLGSNFSHHASKFIGKTCVTRWMDNHPLHQIHLQHDTVSGRVKALAVKCHCLGCMPCSSVYSVYTRWHIPKTAVFMVTPPW